MLPQPLKTKYSESLRKLFRPFKCLEVRCKIGKIELDSRYYNDQRFHAINENQIFKRNPQHNFKP